MNIFLILLIAISLSMDAFSLALSMGTLSLSAKKSLLLSSIVGVFHFFMPTIGTILGSIFVSRLHIESHFLSAIIFFYIAILMFKDFNSDSKEEFKMSLFGSIIFAFGVSLDSFGVGFALNLNVGDLVKSFLIFSIVSFSFTFVGLSLGKRLSSLVGEYSKLIGAIIMCIFSLSNLIKFLFLYL